MAWLDDNQESEKNAINQRMKTVGEVHSDLSRVPQLVPVAPDEVKDPDLLAPPHAKAVRRGRIGSRNRQDEEKPPSVKTPPDLPSQFSFKSPYVTEVGDYPSGGHDTIKLILLTLSNPPSPDLPPRNVPLPNDRSRESTESNVGEKCLAV
jgi:hypothetical protein